MNPSRRAGLVVRSLVDETLVYDPAHHAAHCLNPATASVFALCDGTRDPDEIAAALVAPADRAARAAIVESALGQLVEAQLLDQAAGPMAPPAPRADGSGRGSGTADLRRRELLLRVGAALLVPAITTVVAPTPAEAASACIDGNLDCAGNPLNNGKRCWITSPAQCSPNLCCNYTTGCEPCSNCCP